jgi:2-polyprenyl-3-methyl-5-hydroxy-6-metoxy-1,4-benzoquinol methylase
VTSPLTGNSNVTLVSMLNSEDIIRRYASELNMDVSGLPAKVAIYQCNESGLRFYYPLSMAGDEKFYEELAKKGANYYSRWKWEYSAASSFISANTSLLEIGCGNGYFLMEISKKGVQTSGLEFNDYAIQNALDQKLNVRKEAIQDHALTHENSYNYVCAFQVFEHVPQIREILLASIKALKPGGLLIFGVPNNDSYIFKKDKYHTLNTPPHHILLWDKRSLAQLPTIFPGIHLIKLLEAPEDKVFRGMCYKLFLQQKIGRNIFSDILLTTTRFIVKNFLKNIVKFGGGPTVLAIYQKQ